MAEQIHKGWTSTTTSQRERDGRQAEELATQDAATADTKPKPDAGKLKADIDDLLDEIDGVLEENAADFVRSYVQKGGQ